MSLYVRNQRPASVKRGGGSVAWMFAALAIALAFLGPLAPAAGATAIPAPPGMGNYCSITWPDGGWSFASDPNGGDPCAWIFKQSPPGGTVQRKGLYASNGLNRAVVRCYPPDYGWFFYSQGSGNDPLTAVSDKAQGRPGCIFNVSPMFMPIFNSPFLLSTTNYTHLTGFDFAKDPYKTLNVANFGQVRSSSATIVNFVGKDKTGQGFIDGHDGHDFPMPELTPIYAVADEMVLKARSWLSPCYYSDSPNQNEVAIQHTIVGGSGCKLTETMLRDSGCKVISVGNGTDAVQVVKGFPDEIDVLLTDVIMPGMNGEALFTVLRSERPRLKVVFMSGYTDDVIAPRGVLDPSVPYIAKPFSRDVLVAKIREVLSKVVESESAPGHEGIV